MRKKLLSILALLCLTVTSAWAQEETLLTTIENTGENESFNSGSKTFDNIATVTFSGNVINSGDDYYGWYSDEEGTLTVTAAEGYTITRVKFYNESGSAFDAEAPFEAILVKSGGDNITIVNGTSLGYNGVTKIEVYGYADTPSGPTVVASGDCGTGVTWSLTDDGTLTISGTGAMADYANANAQPWKDSRSSITSIVVGEGVTRIGNNSFRDFTNMTSVTLPEGLETIGNFAFNGCTNASFTSITIPASVTSIGTFAFDGCTSLGSINIPASVTSINTYAFNGCTSLATITLNSNPYLSGSTVYPSTATVTMNLTANGPVDEKYWMTFYNNRYNFVADENTQVFKTELSGTSITLHEVTDKIVTNKTAVVLKSTGNPVMTLTTSTSSNEDANSLRGVISSSGMTASDPSTTYVLNNGSQGVGFYKLASGNTLEAYKAYLRYDGGDAGARAFIGFDEATGIEGVSVNENFENGEVYDLQGRRVVNPTKGLYIVNGKKVFINK